MLYLRQATAATIAVGPFLAKADGLTPVTNLTAASLLNGRAISNGVGAAYAPTSFVHDGNGCYLASLVAGDVPSVNRLLINFSDPLTYGPVWHEIVVYSQAVYDSMFGATALQTTGIAVMLPALLPTGAITSAAFAAGTILPRVALVDSVTSGGGGGGGAAALAIIRQYRVNVEILGKFLAGSYVSAADLGPNVDIPTLIARGEVYDTGIAH